jgi:UrcA family protein
MTTLLARTLLLASATLAAAGPALANVPTTGEAGIRVFYGDLDLSSADGHRTLSRRINRAAEQVCESDYLGSNNRIGMAACINAVRHTAREQLAQVGVEPRS